MDINEIVKTLYRMIYEYGRANDIYLADVGIFLDDHARVRFILKGRSKDKINGAYVDYDFDWVFPGTGTGGLFRQWHEWTVEDKNEERD